MPTREVPRGEWGPFFKGFTQMHQGWLCTMEVLSPAIGAQIEARALPFAGVSAERGSGEPAIRITLGNLEGARVSHVIDGAERVHLEQTDEGADLTLEIEAAGAKTLVTFRVSALPETVDGVA